MADCETAVIWGDFEDERNWESCVRLNYWGERVGEKVRDDCVNGNHKSEYVKDDYSEWDGGEEESCY